MSDMEKIESDEMEQWRIREERKEVYLMVAQGLMQTVKIFDNGKDEIIALPSNVNVEAVATLYAEAIYQGMVKFCGEAK